MKKIIKWLDTKGIKCKPVYFGHDNYFYNAKNIRVEGIAITFNADCTQIYNETIKKVHMIEKYCKRYNYTIINDDLKNGRYYITILTNQDKSALDLYNKFYYKSTAECQQLIHIANIENDFQGLKEKLIKVMNYYGTQYNAALKAINAA